MMREPSGCGLDAAELIEMNELSGDLSRQLNRCQARTCVIRSRRNIIQMGFFPWHKHSTITDESNSWLRATERKLLSSFSFAAALDDLQDVILNVGHQVFGPEVRIEIEPGGKALVTGQM